MPDEIIQMKLGTVIVFLVPALHFPCIVSGLKSSETDFFWEEVILMFPGSHFVFVKKELAFSKQALSNR